jgi:N-methylhydantoinase A
MDGVVLQADKEDLSLHDAHDPMPAPMEVAVDIGGTFTDFVFFNKVERTLFVRKVPSTPGDPAAALLTGVETEEMTKYGRFVHATTVVLNAILEQSGATTALVTTAGFRGHIEIGDTKRHTGGLFDHTWRREKPFPVPSHCRFIVRERMSARGEPLVTPVESDLDRLVEDIQSVSAVAVAVCFINSYANPSHELIVKDWLSRRLPELRVFVSSDVPEFREFPRFITTVMNAFVSVRTSAYVERLAPALRNRGYRYDVKYMGSAGGVQDAAAVIKRPLCLLMGGVVGGVTAGMYLSRQVGIPDAVTFDMGGTSTDVALIKRGSAQTAGDRIVGAFPVAMRQVDVNSIGAGGGSIAWTGSDGALKVGPHSAGSEPGPACYGRGGNEFTITDANLLLGRIGADSLLNGGMHLDRQRAEVIGRRLANHLGLDSLLHLANGVLEVANTNLDGAIRQVSVERGEDPAGLALIAFGGAGPMHCCDVAARLGIRTVVVPRDAGNFSAWGLLVSDERHDYVRSFMHPLAAADLKTARRLFAAMETEGRGTLEAAGFSPSAISLRYTLDMRYIGQAFEEEITLKTVDDILAPHIIGRSFRDAYHRRYGYARPIEMAEISNLRLTAIGVTENPELDRQLPTNPGNGAAETSRAVFFNGGWIHCPVLPRAHTATGATIAGPAILAEYDSTTVLPPGWQAVTDTYGNLLIERRANHVTCH